MIYSIKQQETRILPRGSLVLRTNTIKPVIGSAEVSSRIPNNRNVELFQRAHDVLSETILVGQRVTGVIDAAVDASAHVPIEKELVHCPIDPDSIN